MIVYMTLERPKPMIVYMKPMIVYMTLEKPMIVYMTLERPHIH